MELCKKIRSDDDNSITPIIVVSSNSEKEHISMEKIKKFNKDYTNDSINEMTKGFLIEENKRLKQEIETLKNSKEEIENTSQEDIDYDYE